jgi:hypothetical protein
MPDSLLPLPDEPQDLIGFVEARLTEDETAARAATGEEWRYNPRKQWLTEPDAARRALLVQIGVRGEEFVAAGPLDDPLCVAATGPADDPQSMLDASFIARHDPARTLRAVGALRSVVEECKDTMEWSKQLRREGRPDDAYARHVGSLLGVLRGFAAVWSEHPDFRPEWSPDAH